MFRPSNNITSRFCDVTERFCDSFRDKMQWLISRAAAKRPSSASDGDQVERGYLHTKTVEIIQHLTMCQERSAEFRGREDTLHHLRLYIQPQLQQQQNTQLWCDDDISCDVEIGGLMTNRPLVVYGQSGSGKTAVMAKVNQYSLYCLQSCILYE